MAKPKKALRGLFARTEPTTVATDDVTSHRSIKKALGIRETPAVEPEELPIVEEIVAAPIVEESVAVQAADDVTPHHHDDAEVLLEPAQEVLVEVQSPLAQSIEEPVEPEQILETIASEPATTTPVQEIVHLEMPVAEVRATEAAVVVTHEVHNANVAAAVANIQYNFNLSREDRETWAEGEYIDCIRRIDVAQAEAFFLKGKLLGEVKDRFYQENKNGWKNFSEGSLGMNYTTVNQYIRVAQEFDVASHRRPDFGFEHYKALLPLKADERVKLLGELPQVSVKELRNIVQRKLQEDGIVPARSQRVLHSKELIELLLDLKTKIFDCTPETMDQKDRWQLTAACRNLADDLSAVANHLSDFGKRGADVSHRASIEHTIESGV